MKIEILTAVAEALGARCVSHSNGDVSKFIEGKWIRKPGVQTTDLRHVWFDECPTELIDTRYYNLDGSKK